MKKLKKLAGIILSVLIIMSMCTGCQTSQSDQTVEAEKVEDQLLDEEPEKTQVTQEKQVESEEEYYSLDSVQDNEEIDYSKYEEKKSSSESNKKNGEDASVENTERSQEGSNVTYSTGEQNGQDEYMTDPIPEGMQNPVEPGDVEINEEKELTCYLTISCATILNNMEQLTEGKEDLVPSDGIIYARNEVTFYEGESVFDVLLRETQSNRIHMEYSFFPGYNSNYVEGINNLYEFDCGELSGWMYRVNGWYPNYGCSRYLVQDGDEIEWNYTCDHGRDVGRE